MYKVERTKGDIIFNIFINIIVILLLVIFMYPVLNILVLSLSSPDFSTTPGLKLLPDKVSFVSYQIVFKNGLIATGYLNTIIRVTIGTILTILFTYCGGYALTKKKLPFRTSIMVFILFTMFFNGGLIPTYLQIKSLGLLDKRWVLILPYLTNAWNLIITYNFINTIPKSLEESAFVDGAHPLKVIFQILMPLSMPIIAVLAVWTAVFHWNAWFDALIYIRPKEKMVLQLVLRKIIIDQDQELIDRGVIMLKQLNTSPETVKAAMIITSTVPVLFIYPFLQKYFTKGVLIGSIKG